MVGDQRDHDLTIARGAGRADQRIVAIENAGLDHRVPRHFERIMLARPEQRGGNRQAALPFQRLDREAGGDPAVQRDVENILVGGLWHRRGNLGLGGGRGGRRLARHRLGHAEHLQRAGAIGQAADEVALLERADQAVDARLGLEIERLLHLLERR